MRISDWSSDVCSSDLLGASFVRILGYFHEDGVKSVAAIEAAMRRADSAALVLPAHTLKGESHQFGAGPLALLRSEEHTSELQSLMRISYAVFCLTKKQKKPKTDRIKRTTYRPYIKT